MRSVCLCVWLRKSRSSQVPPTYLSGASPRPERSRFYEWTRNGIIEWIRNGTQIQISIGKDHYKRMANGFSLSQQLRWSNRIAGPRIPAAVQESCGALLANVALCGLVLCYCCPEEREGMGHPLTSFCLVAQGLCNKKQTVTGTPHVLHWVTKIKMERGRPMQIFV